MSAEQMSAELMSAELMSAEQGAAEADVIIGARCRDWVRLFRAWGWIFVPAAFTFQNGLALFWLGLGGAVVARGLWFRRFAVDLTPGPVSPGGLGWRRLPQTTVQAVVRHRRRGAWVVRLMLHSGDPAKPDPATWRRVGHAEQVASLQPSQRWWLAHRAQSLGPIRAETPTPRLQR
jgi:hypothetical protein